jgi:hypothetical protein
MYIFMLSACYCWLILTKIGKCRHILRKYPNMRCHENPFSRHAARQMDGQTQVDMVMLIDKFFKLSIVNIPNIVIMAE